MGIININIVPVGTFSHIFTCLHTLSIFLINSSLYKSNIYKSSTDVAGTVKIDSSKGVSKIDLSIWSVSTPNTNAIIHELSL
jgi:hypothetical protein